MTDKKKMPEPGIQNMDAILKYCALIQDVKIIMKQQISMEQMRTLNNFVDELDRRNRNAVNTRQPMPAPESLYLYFIFLYGYISGIRAERQKKNRRKAA